MSEGGLGSRHTDRSNAIIDEAIAASEAVQEKSVRWLMLHPRQHRRMRKRLILARQDLDSLRRELGLA